MLYTRFKEIDNALGGIENGELVVIASDTWGEYFQHNILYNFAKQADTNNRKNIKNYDKKIKKILNYEEVKLKNPIEKILVLGQSKLNYDVISNFPRGRYEKEQFDLFKKKRLLFKDLPIEQSFYNISHHSANVFIKEITYFDKTQIKALYIFGNHKKIPLLKEVAQKMNIPVVMFIYDDKKSVLQRLKSKIENIDKLIVLEDNYFKSEYADTPYEKSMTLYLKNIKTGFEDKIILNYCYQLYIEFEEDYKKYHLNQANCAYILERMARNNNYINKYNFSKYLHLSGEKKQCFWAYIDVFQRIQIDDLYELLKEYRKGADEQELTLATVILRKLLARYDDEKHITISN